jgi:hypothetical protein
MQLATTTQQPSITELEAMAGHIVKSGLFGIKKVEEAVALMLIAVAEHRHPGTVASEYNIILGRPALKADAILARFQSAGGKVEWHDYTDTIVSGTFCHPAGGSLKVDWDMDRAKAAGLGGKDNWKKFPRQMLRARCISDGVRGVYPAVLQGFYTPEEVQDFAPSTSAPAPAPAPAIVPAPAKKAKKVEPEPEVIEIKAEEVKPNEIVVVENNIVAEDATWINDLEPVLGQNEDAVNAFLATKGQIDAGKTWRDLEDNEYRKRIIANPAGFVGAATGGKK